MNKKLLFTLACIFTSACILSAQQPQELVPTYKDIRYGASSDRILDIHLPDNHGKSCPVVVFIHGGGFSGGDKGALRSQAAVFKGFLDRGYAVVSINYFLQYGQKEFKGSSVSSETKAVPTADFRFSGKLNSAIKAAVDDACCAIQWVGKNARKYNLDKNRLVICGGSAGAMTCLYTAYTREIKGVKIRGVVNLWGAMDDVTMIKNASIPMLTIHGDKDELINIAYGEAIAARMAEIGSEKSKFILLKGKGHAQYKYVAAHYMDDINNFIKSIL